MKIFLFFLAAVLFGISKIVLKYFAFKAAEKQPGEIHLVRSIKHSCSERWPQLEFPLFSALHKGDLKYHVDLEDKSIYGNSDNFFNPVHCYTYEIIVDLDMHEQCFAKKIIRRVPENFLDGMFADLFITHWEVHLNRWYFQNLKNCGLTNYSRTVNDCLHIENIWREKKPRLLEAI